MHITCSGPRHKGERKFNATTDAVQMAGTLACPHCGAEWPQISLRFVLAQKSAATSPPPPPVPRSAQGALL